MEAEEGLDGAWVIDVYREVVDEGCEAVDEGDTVDEDCDAVDRYDVLAGMAT